jgi:hypothetical protein
VPKRRRRPLPPPAHALLPAPQVERIRSTPGARLPPSANRSLPLRLSLSRCGARRTTAVHGELWGEATGGSGLEAVTPHLRFVYEPG